jgi:hypothetical protein
MAAQECDCDFITSGHMVVDGKVLEKCKEIHVREPIEHRGVDGNLWIWEPPNYTRNYLISADVSRGDGSDFSAFHVMDIDRVEQVAEYKGKMSTKDFGNLCLNTALEYNNALLIVENNNIGWAALQQIIDREYDNLFYTSKDLHYVDVQHQISNKYRNLERNMVPGFSTTIKTRPMIVAKLEEYFRENEIIVHSSRLIDELFVFIWKNQRAEAMTGYNDDLVMSFAIGLWVRDTALRLKNEGIELQKKVLGKLLQHEPVYASDDGKAEGWEWDTGYEKESLEWLIK